MFSELCEHGERSTFQIVHCHRVCIHRRVCALPEANTSQRAGVPALAFSDE